VESAEHVVRVAVDVPALADQGREFDYLAPAGIEIGTMVRVPLHGRRVAGWVVDVDVEPVAGMRLARVAKVSGRGPAPDVVALSAWGAWRWAGRRTALLRAASPPKAVTALPPAGRWSSGHAVADAAVVRLAAEARAAGEAVVRVPPATDPVPFVAALLAAGPALVISPAVEGARSLAARLRAERWPVTGVPEGWARAAAGPTTVIGARAAVWAPTCGVETIVVLDAHDSGLVESRAPAWSAWVVAAERARRGGVPCVLVSPCPLLEQLQWGRLLVPARDDERRGWARVEVLDRTRDDPRSGLLPERLVPILRSASPSAPVLCVLNRKGRARALACRVCGRATVCEHCGGGVATAGDLLACQRCHRTRPVVCQTCGSTALRATRVGVTKLRDDLEALARLPVAEVTAEAEGVPQAPILIGTEAVLHRVASASVVVFLDFDGELLAPRLRAAEDALALLARASRVAGRRDGPGRVIVQTRQPDHPVVQAAVRADPGRLTSGELAVRAELALPPTTALAEVSGDADVVAAFGTAVAGQSGVEVLPLEDGRLLVRAPDHRVLCDALAATGRPAGVGGDRLRIEVDPQRI
jgi:primosomal protein N' (replication factor Y)